MLVKISTECARLECGVESEKNCERACVLYWRDRL